MFCSNCGNKLNGNEDFCSNCGNNIENQKGNIKQEHKLLNHNILGVNHKSKKNKSKRDLLILIMIMVFLIIVSIGVFIIVKNKDNNKEDNNNNNDINNDINSEFENDGFDVYSSLYLDYQNNKITTDEYVKYSLYAQYDSSLLGSDYATLNGADYAIDVEELINTYYDELSDSTLRYFAEKINLDGVTFELDKENEEQNDDVALTDLLFEKVYAKADKVTNLNKAVLSSNGNFVVWYTTTGNSATNYSSAKKVADGLENTVTKYKDLFGNNYKYSSDVMSKGKTYKNQIKILENSNIDKSYLENAMQVYLLEYNNSALAQYISGYGKAKEVLNSIFGGDDYGVIAYPYIVIKPSSFSDFERLEQLYNHELFHHYQKYILCDLTKCDITDPYISEATANWASSLATKKTSSYGFLNEWAGTARKYSSDLMSDDFAKKYGIDNVGYALFVYLNNYSSFVNNGTKKITNSMYKTNSLLYLEDNATKEELTKIQETIAFNNLSQNYSNKNLLVDISKNLYPVILKGTAFANKSFDNMRLNKGAIDYYCLDYDLSKKYEITLVRDNNNVMATLIGEKSNKYELLQTSTIDKTRFIFNTNDYKDDYEKIYIAVLNILPGLENYYSLSVEETEVIEKEEIDENDNSNSDSNSNINLEFETTFNNYNIEIEMDIAIGGINTNTVSKGIVDELHQKEYLNVTTTSMGLISLTNKVYHDFNSGYTYMTQPYGGDVWLKEKSTSQMVDLGVILDKLISMKNVIKIADNHYKVKMTKEDVQGLMTSGNTNTSAINGDIYVEVYTENGYITKLEYDFSEMIKEFDLFTTTIKFSNYDKAGNVEIPQSIIDNAKAQ